MKLETFHVELRTRVLRRVDESEAALSRPPERPVGNGVRTKSTRMGVEEIAEDVK